MRRLLFTTLLAFALVTFSSASAFAIGLLLPSDANQRPFDIESHRANVTITNNAAVTTVEQVFRNHTNRPMEAVFVFPVPEGATVSDFSLWINGKKTPGAVLEKGEARRIYEDIVRRTRDPGLIEYIDGKLFRASIFPIPPKGTQKLELKFAQVLKPRGGMYRYFYPIRAGADYVTAKTEKDFTVTVNVNSSVPVTNVYSPSHTIGVHRKKNGKVLVGTEEMHANLDRDFELFLGYSREAVGVNFLMHDPDGDGGENPYFMMALAPRVDAKAHDENGQTFTFVMDTSGSMAGPNIEQARRTIEYCVKRLKPQDNFNVIRFSTDVEALFDQPVAATAENTKRGIAFARELQPAGGTAIHGALKAALAQTTANHQPHQVIFVTDGLPTVGPASPNEIMSAAKNLLKRNTRVFTFGVGYDVNTVLLDGLATAARGKSDYVKPKEDMETAVGALYDRISAPVLSDIAIDFGGARVYDVYPTPIPDMFQGDQILVFGRMRSGFKSAIAVKGRVGKDEKTFTYGGGKAKGRKTTIDEGSQEPLEFLPKLWATRKVGYLLEQIRLNGEVPELKNEVVRLSKKFGLVTPYTSYLAVDDSEFDRRPPRRDNIDTLSETFDSTPREPRPRKVRRRPRPSSAPAAEERAKSFSAFGADSGAGGVAASEATRDYKESEKVENEASSTRRFVANRTFTWTSDTWVEEGVSAKAKAKTVKAFSKEYFALIRKHPELKRIVALGDRILVKLGHDIYRITP